MNCPACGLKLELKKIQELDEFALVQRECSHCEINWELKYIGTLVVSITQGGIEVGDYGFDYKCPNCNFSSTVYTVFHSSTGWKCLKCGKIISNKYIKPRGNFPLEPVRVTIPGTRKGTLSQLGYQRTPRASRPVPTGAVGVAQIAQELNVEPKKLRSWLRKVNWRSSEEHGSQWLFSPEEVKEVISSFKR